jgi:serine/threonine protein kinase/tetratricopeptide (TPR) repeat protein
LIGRTLSRYRILEPLGAGGMGEVYRARDSRLERDVAVKVLPARLAGDPDARRRFEREARAVAALQHPNVLAIHDFGVEDDVAFAVMELLRGETLRDEMSRTGAIDASRAVAVARQAAAGLAAAHDRGIVHRDLKPENLFVTEDGTLKILDFGLAKSMAAGRALGPGVTQDLTAATRPGMVLGTAAYMAPEQARGEELDARTDLFALGVILYEMLTGESPFRRDTPLATLGAVLHDDPPRVESAAPGLPAGLAQLVSECLEKSPERRPSSAREIARRLESSGPEGRPAATARPAPEAIDSLAVLPFVNESGDADTDFLSDGLTDNLIDNLSQLPSLRVMARSTVFHYRDGAPSPREIAEALGVRAVLTGRLRRRGEQLVVRTELVDAADGTRLWGGRFDRAATDLLHIEDEIALEISEKLRLTLSSEERSLLAKRHTRDPEAYEAYLRGRHVWNQWKTPEGMRAAIGFFERALEIDPLFARAFAGLADGYNMLGNLKMIPPGEAYPRAKTAAQQGLAIDERVAELHTSLGFIHRHWDWDWEAAERSYRRAIELNPGYPAAHRFYGHLLAGLGRHDESIAASARAVELDPLSLLIRGALGDSYFYARRYDEAIALYRETLEMDPTFLAGHTDLARALELAGRHDEAIAEFRAAEALAPKGPPEPSSGLAHVYAAMGRREDALAIVAELVQLSRRRYVSPYGLGSIHACLGETETALDWLERAYAEHDQTLVWLKVHPRLDALREHPRYRALVRKMKLDG